MFEGRFGELILIFVVALVVLGPEKLPRVVAEVGRWVGRARAMARQFREQLEEEVQLEEMRKAQATKPQSAPPPESPETHAGPAADVGEALSPEISVPSGQAETHVETHEGTAAPFHPESTADLMSPPPEVWSTPSATPPIPPESSPAHPAGDEPKTTAAAPHKPTSAQPEQPSHPVTGESEHT